MTEAKVNFNFEEARLGQTEVVVTNSTGRALEHLELVLLNGYFGEVREFDGIADGASGVINIDSNREIGTNQIETADTFVVGDPVYFLPGTTAPGTLVAASATGNAPVGIITDVNAGVSVTFRPFVQRVSADGIVLTA